MTAILHRAIGTTPPRAVAGDGVFVIDEQGRRYLDACGGAAVSCLGHSHPAVVAAIREQASRLAYAHTSFFTSEPAEELAAHLIERAPAGLSHAFFVSGGSEAMETALKLARQYYVEIGQPERSVFVSRKQSYHGNTLGALAVGGNEWRRKQFAPLLIDTVQVSACYEYRGRRQGESPQAYGRRLVAELEVAFERIGPQRVLAFLAETVGGATSGAITAVPGYFKGVRELCDRHGILLILDEVMCGMGRTGTLFACEQEGVAPDIVAIAKGLGAGYQPIGAALLSRRIFDAFRDGSGFFQHGHTYLGHVLACTAALEVQRTIEREGLLANVRKRSLEFEAALNERFAGHRHVGDLRGRGLFRAIELVAERDGKTAFDPALKVHARIKKAAMERGLMCYPMGGTIDGERGDHVLLAPPFIVDSGHIEMIVDRLDAAIGAAIASLPAARAITPD
ncbi:MAG: aspartate aminotransferase family protein [Burkholderiaceae bacterium]|nr:aspartate aminotransferase family protein [Burkholderiaceae bacterium]